LSWATLVDRESHASLPHSRTLRERRPSTGPNSPRSDPLPVLQVLRLAEWIASHESAISGRRERILSREQKEGEVEKNLERIFVEYAGIQAKASPRFCKIWTNTLSCEKPSTGRTAMRSSPDNTCMTMSYPRATRWGQRKKNKIEHDDAGYDDIVLNATGEEAASVVGGGSYLLFPLSRGHYSMASQRGIRCVLGFHGDIAKSRR